MTVGAISTTPAASSPESVTGPAGDARRLHLLGIRHHGPGSARSVRRALDVLRPDVVLVEAPADAGAALGWIGHSGLNSANGANTARSWRLTT